MGSQERSGRTLLPESSMVLSKRRPDLSMDSGRSMRKETFRMRREVLGEERVEVGTGDDVNSSAGVVEVGN